MEFINNFIYLEEVLGTAIALNILLEIPIFIGVVITIFTTLLFLMIQLWSGIRMLEVNDLSFFKKTNYSKSNKFILGNFLFFLDSFCLFFINHVWLFLCKFNLY